MIICVSFSLISGVLGAFSMSLSLVISPLTIAICRRKSTRLTAVLGGLITALGCLFTSFASQFHQLFFSYGIMIGNFNQVQNQLYAQHTNVYTFFLLPLFKGIGVGMSRDPATLMIGQYFKRKREIVEVILVSSTGVGLSFMSVFLQASIK